MENVVIPAAVLVVPILRTEEERYALLEESESMFPCE